MAATRMTFVLYKEDDTEEEVVADQRDFAAFEKVEHMAFFDGLKERTALFCRYVSWHAQVRTEVIDPKTTFEAWDKLVVEAELKSEDDEPVDPGQTAASDATSSTSP